MNKQRTIKKILVLAAWTIVIGGMTTLLIAANSRKRTPHCKKVVIGIRGTGDHVYIEEGDILVKLERAIGGRLVNRPITAINLAKLEDVLEGSAWIHDAELYFDNSDVLHVTVSEREPIARIFTTAGTSFYLDSAGTRMPLLEKLTARVPVVTNFTNAKRYSKADSFLLKEVKAIATYIYQDPFWNAQVGQIDITPERRFEIIPVIGNHVIRIGSTEKIGDKLHNLKVFYRQVLSKTGFDKYAVLDARFEGQVIGVHRGTASPVDSIQLQKNIEELLNKSMETELVNQLPAPARDSASISSTQTNEARATTTSLPQPVKAISEPKKWPAKSKSVEKPKREKKERPRPKAIMTKRN